jgi:hypothetical protein
MDHGGCCYCGAIRFQVEGEPRDVSVCHCRDCQRHAGAPMVAWAGYAAAQVSVTRGRPKTISLGGAALRSFCADCGTGLFYQNAEVLPGVIEIQSAVFDEPEALVPTMQIQTAERLTWMTRLHDMPAYERFAE